MRTIKLASLTLAIVICGQVVALADMDRPLPSFKVVAIRATSEDEESFIDLPEKPKLIEYTSGKMIFYEVEKIAKEGKNFIVPKVRNGKQVPLDPAASGYFEFLKQSFYNRLRCLLVADGYEMIAIGIKMNVFADPRPNEYFLRKFEKHDEFTSLINIGRVYDTQKDFKEGTFFLVDYNLNYELQSFEDGRYVLEKREALNYDTIKGDCPGSEYFANAGYKGCLWMQLGNAKAYVKDKTSVMPYPLELKNNYLSVPARWFIENLMGSNKCEYNSKAKEVKIEKFLNNKWRAIIYKIGSTDYTFDGKTYKATFAPYQKPNGTVMVPLKINCDHLELPVRWRPYDKTALIHR